MGLFDFNDVSVVGPALNAMAQITAAGVSAHENKKAMERQFKMNKYMAEWQNQVNKENWQMQNAYNSPSAQMERLRQAGLNPNLVTGSSNQSGNAGSIPAFDAPRYEAFHEWDKVSDRLPDILNSLMQVAQVKKVEQETANLKTYQRNMNTENAFNELRMIGQRALNSKTNYEASIWGEYWDKKMMQMFADSQLKDANRFLTDSQRTYLEGPQTENTLTNTARTIADIGLMEYRKEVLRSQAASYMASAGLSIAQANKIATLLPLESDFMQTQTDYNMAKTSFQRFENTIASIFLNNGVDLREGRLDKQFVKSLAWQLWQGMKKFVQ